MGTKLVRVRPPNGPGDRVIGRHCVGGVRFEQGGGWYEVPDSMAAELAEVHVSVEDKTSPLAFDICGDREAALALEERVRKEQEAKRSDTPSSRVHEWAGKVKKLGTISPSDAKPPAESAAPVLEPPEPLVAPGALENEDEEPATNVVPTDAASSGSPARPASRRVVRRPA